MHIHATVPAEARTSRATASAFGPAIRTSKPQGSSSGCRAAWRPQEVKEPAQTVHKSYFHAWRSLALFERFLDETERVGVLDQRSNFRTIQTGWNFGIDLEFQGHLAAGKGGELLDDGLDDLMDVPRRALR